MRNTKSAFTLVELIVVITILAILGTIAFISLQGYSAEARNSKRLQDLGSINSALNIKLTRGMDVMSAIANANNADTAIALGGTASGTVSAASDYNAGEVNYTAVDMKASEFQDPLEGNYVIGATTYSGGPFQLAATVESDGGKVAKLTGNYNQRTSTGYTGKKSADNRFTLTSLTDSGNFRVKDLVTIGSNDYNISKISTDGLSITLDKDYIGTDGDETSIKLANDESSSLILGTKEDASASGSISEGGEFLPY